jgi:hypothetical protein
VDGFEALGREQRSLKAFYTAGQSPPTCGCQLIINLPFGIGCLGSTLFRGGRALQAFGDAIAKVLEHPTFPRLNAQGDFAAKGERRPAPERAVRLITPAASPAARRARDRGG